MTYHLVLLTVPVCHRLALCEMLLKLGVDHKLLSYGVARQLPGKLILPSCLLIKVGGIDNVLISVLDVSVV